MYVKHWGNKIGKVHVSKALRSRPQGHWHRYQFKGIH